MLKVQELMERSLVNNPLPLPKTKKGKKKKSSLLSEKRSLCYKGQELELPQERKKGLYPLEEIMNEEPSHYL